MKKKRLHSVSDKGLGAAEVALVKGGNSPWVDAPDALK